MNLLHHLDTWFERYLALCAVATLAWCFAATRYKARQRPSVSERRDWYCTDGLWRTESEAATWVAKTDGSLAEWLAVWPTDAEPLYVPREWVTQ